MTLLYSLKGQRHFPGRMIMAALVFLFVLFLPVIARAESTLWFNSIQMSFVTIPVGSFVMGSCILTKADAAENASRAVLGLSPIQPRCLPGTPIDDQAEEDEAPQHEVQITQPFQLSRYEVTLAQFKRFIGESGRSNFLTKDFISANNQGDDAPVVAVSWEQAQAFIAWLNRKEGGHHYRLPSEAEWEYAARAGSRSRWSFNGRYSDYAWYDSNSGGQQHTVGKKAPNAWSLYDMHGNVWEWVADWYAADFYHHSGDQSPARLYSGTMRVARGGGWNSPAEDLRSANRGSALPDSGYDFVGFRVLRE